MDRDIKGHFPLLHIRILQYVSPSLLHIMQVYGIADDSFKFRFSDRQSNILLMRQIDLKVKNCKAKKLVNFKLLVILMTTEVPFWIFNDVGRLRYTYTMPNPR